MVKLNKIYTRTGDGGETSLVDGRRVAKSSRRPAAFGEVEVDARQSRDRRDTLAVFRMLGETATVVVACLRGVLQDRVAPGRQAQGFGT